MPKTKSKKKVLSKTFLKKRLAALKRWVKALRSGKYEQARYQLHSSTTGGYCCLGVACKVHPKLVPQDWVEKENLSAAPRLEELLGVGRTGSLIKGVRVPGCFYQFLTSLNDCADFTFKQIADVIERQFIKPLERKLARMEAQGRRPD